MKTSYEVHGLDELMARFRRDGFDGNSHQSEIALLLSAICRIAARRNLANAVCVRAYVIHKQQGSPKATMAIRPG